MTLEAQSQARAEADAAPVAAGRAGWEATADRLLAATGRWGSPSGSLLSLPGAPSRSGRWSDGLEGFARTFLLAAFRVRGAGGADPAGVLERYARGLRAGTDPSHPERWPRMGERRQARVEAAGIAIALHETRPWLWDLLDERTRSNVVQWLSDIVGTSDYDNNWIWFQNIVETFLRSVGGPWSQADFDRNRERHEGWYLGGGWFTDGSAASGARQNIDYYTGWAWHFYPLWASRIAGTAPEPVHLDRLGEYLGTARRLIGADGGPLFQGRSLTYRFAMLVPFFVGEVFEVTPLAPGESGELGDRVLSYFLDRGAVDEEGLLSVGWHGRFPGIRQLYTGPASPYWASKAFVSLLLPEGHRAWAGEGAGGSSDVSDSVFTVPEAGWLVSSTASDGIVRVINHGTDRRPGRAASLDDPFYLRYAYSTRTSPELDAASLTSPDDSNVAVLDGRGRSSHRGRLERVSCEGNAAVSRSFPVWLDELADPATQVPDASASVAVALPTGSAEWPTLRRGPAITVGSIVRGAWEVRVARIDGIAARAGSAASGGAPAEDPDEHWPVEPGPWRVRLSGWAVADDEAPLAEERSATASASESVPVVVRVLTRSGLVSEAGSCLGFDGGVDAAVRPSQGSNPFGSYSATPSVATVAALSDGDLVAAVFSLRGTDQGADDLPHLPTVTAHPTPDGTRIEVAWPAGPLDHLTLPFPPASGSATAEAVDEVVVR